MELVADHANADTLCAVEATLVEYAGSVTSRELGRLVRQLPDRFDIEGVEAREEALRRRSGVTIRQLPTGLTRVIADLHPEAAGFFTAALDARTAPRRQVTFADLDGADTEAGCDCAACEEYDRDAAASRAERVMGVGFLIRLAAIADVVCSSVLLTDTRTLAQKRLDALEAMARESLAHDTGTLAGTPVTMLVTVPLEALQTGVGTAQIAGIDEPISAGSARRLAACAEIIPVVLGSDSEPLDLGRCERLFTAAQRRALAVRDGGCIWPGCTAPPGWCEVAHLIAWILGGLTNLDNAALMCPHHHRRFDRDGWALHREHGTPYLIPPPWLDPEQTPRGAGRLPVLAA